METPERSMACPLCMIVDLKEEVRGADKRRYHLCSHCLLIFVHPDDHLSQEEEKAHYKTHENSIENTGYVRFLNRVLKPTLPYLNPTMRGLDYGCGPGPVLAELVRQNGISCENYDPYFTEREVDPPYDFILSTECFEHFHSPNWNIQHICDLLKPNGLLGKWTTREQFAEWYYTKDPTHTSFYHQKTLEFLEARFGLQILWQEANRVVIFRKRKLASLETSLS